MVPRTPKHRQVKFKTPILESDNDEDFSADESLSIDELLNLVKANKT